jgi:hypothetical protein
LGAFLSLINPIGTILDKILPDKAQNDAAKAQLVQLQMQGELNAVAAQVQVNIAEAQSKSTFVAGWRPFVGWVCGIAFAYAFVLQPFLQFILVAFHVNFDVAKLPVISMSEISPVLLGMLGLAAARTVEKVQGVDAGH